MSAAHAASARDRDALASQAQVLAALPEGVSVVSALDGRFLYTNAAFDAMFGYAPGELLGQPVSTVNAPGGASPEAIGRRIMDAVRARGRWDGDLRQLRKDGSTFRSYNTVTLQELPGWGTVMVAIQRDVGTAPGAEAELRLRGMYLRTLLDHVPFPVWIRAPQGLFLAANQALAALAGLEHAQALLDPAHPAEVPEELALHMRLGEARALASAQPCVQECALGSGPRRSWWEMFQSPIRLGDATVGILGLARDVGDRRSATQALRHRQRWLQAIVEQLPVGVVLADAQGRTLLSNSLMRGYTGGDRMPSLSERQIPRWAARAPDGTRLAPADWPGARALRGESVSQGVEFDHRAANGTHKTVLVSAVPFRDDDGRIGGAVAVAQDITQHKLAEAAVRASEEQLRLIAEHHPDGIFHLDREHRLRYLNATTASWLGCLLRRPGLQPSDVLGRRVWEFLGDSEISRDYRRHSEQAMREGQASSVEESVVVGAQAHHRLKLRTPIRNAAGEVVGLLGIVRDISALRREEQARLERMREQRDALVREVHHRIKNHLQGVLGLLRLKIDRHPALREALAEAMSQVQAIADVYGLTQRRANAGAELVHIVDLLVRGASAAVPIRFERGRHESMSLGEADAVPIALVINELLSNASKHLARRDPARPVRLRLDGDERSMRIRIRNGPAWLPAGFDFAARRGIGTGLELLDTLLPSRGAQLSIVQDGDEVLAELVLHGPVVVPR
jgi:PAS domain S-box-containing protein